MVVKRLAHACAIHKLVIFATYNPPRFQLTERGNNEKGSSSSGGGSDIGGLWR
jgi:hypothetical protein